MRDGMVMFRSYFGFFKYKFKMMFIVVVDSDNVSYCSDS